MYQDKSTLIHCLFLTSVWCQKLILQILIPSWQRQLLQLSVLQLFHHPDPQSFPKLKIQTRSTFFCSCFLVLIYLVWQSYWRIGLSWHWYTACWWSWHSCWWRRLGPSRTNWRGRLQRWDRCRFSFAAQPPSKPLFLESWTTGLDSIQCSGAAVRLVNPLFWIQPLPPVRFLCSVEHEQWTYTTVWWALI